MYFILLKNIIKKVCQVIYQNCIFHNRYNPKVFQNEGIEYAEIYVRGTGRAPPDFVVSEVK